LVQGITGRSGALQSKVMLEYGTNIVAGVTPGKGGTSVHGIPVYDFVQEARQQHPFNVVVSFVPPAAAKDSCMEALDCGIDLLVLTSEGIPDHDVVDVIAYAESKGTRLIGPGAAGVIVPGKSKVGSHPPRFFTPGRVGIVSKSGALSYEIGKTLTDAGIGQSTVIAIGGGPFWGTTQRDAIQLFEADEETEVIVVLGEIGGSLEEEAAKYIASCVRKPVVALIVGHAAPPGKSLGHAGAIVSGDTGSAASKIAALQNAGVRVAATPSEVVTYVRELGG
jgi:succinyl-CoA synthetase alpha subunit